MRASIRKSVVLNIALLAAVLISSCQSRPRSHDEEYLAYNTPPPEIQLCVDAQQIETRPIDAGVMVQPPIQPPLPPPVRPPERPPVRPPINPPVHAPVNPPVDVKPPPVKPPIAVRPPVNLPPVRTAKAIRIKAGSARNWKDKDGLEWLADAGFSEGAMVDNGPVKIGNTANAELYTSEHSNMEKFTWPLPNGKYLVKLHFAENLEDVKKPGDRVFSVDVAGKNLKDLDVFKEAGGVAKALVKEFHVTITGGKLEINFTKSEHREPFINGIEIIPE